MPDFDLPRHNDRRQKKRDKRRQKKTKISAAAAVTGTEPAPFAFNPEAAKRSRGGKSKGKSKHNDGDEDEDEEEMQVAGRHAMMAEDTAAAAAAATASSSSSSSSGRKSSGGAAASKVDLDVLLGVRERVCPRDVFAWLIAPESLETFFSERWEKRSAVIRRNEPGRYSKLFSSEVLDTILRENHIKFGVNLDLTRYENEQRSTVNPGGRAHRSVVWSHFEDGCSIRMLNPHTFHPPIWRVVAALQEYFGCMVGVNSYLTPAGHQGFSPHYDDIEAFVVQIEGSKRWRLYGNPEGQLLPRYSSRNFEQREIGQPVLETVLHAGDVLYMPRGVVHQAVSVPESHSLHLTFSTYQNTAWIDLLEKLVPQTLALAADEDLEFRTGLPLNYLDYMGLANADSTDPRRAKFVKTCEKLIRKLAEDPPIDAAVDQMAVEFLHTSMPPALAESEKPMSFQTRAYETHMRVPDPLSSISRVRVVRKYAGRLVSIADDDEDSIRLFYTSDNAMFFKGNEEQFIDLPIEAADMVEFLLANDDKFVTVAEIPTELSPEMQISLLSELYHIGLLLVEEPIQSGSESESDEEDEEEDEGAE